MRSVIWSARVAVFLLVVVSARTSCLQHWRGGFGVAVADQQAGSSRVPVIRMLEAQLRSNYDRVSTWSATCELKDGAFRNSIPRLSVSGDGEIQTVVRRGNFWVERQVVNIFYVDCRANKLFTTYEVVGDTRLSDRDTRKVEEFQEVPLRRRHVITGEEWIQGTPAPDDTTAKSSIQIERGKGVNSAVRKLAEESEAFKTYSMVIDPRKFFTISRDMTFADAMKVNADWLESGKSLPLQIKETTLASGIAYVLRQEFRLGDAESEPPTVTETTFDSSVGYQPTRVVESAPKGFVMREREWRYELVSEAYVPTWYRLVKYFDDGSGGVEISREFSMRDVRVNEPVDEDWFSLNRLGLIEGDQLRDDVAGTTQRYSEGHLIAADKYIDSQRTGSSNAGSVQPVASSGRLMLLLIVNGGLLGFGGLLWFLRRRKTV